MQRISNYFNRIFELDLRSLGLFRFLLGLVCIADAVTRFVQMNDFYTDNGIVTRSYFLTNLSHPWSFSFHLISGETWAVGILFIIHILTAFSFMVGYKTRISNFILWLFVVSVHNRFWYVNNGGDDVMRILLFFCMFLPVSHYFSIDGISKEKPKIHTSFWTFAFILQISFVYCFSYILKDGHQWRSTYNATFIAFNLEIFTTFIAKFLLKYPNFLKLITAFTIYLEGFGVFILLAAFNSKAKNISRYLAISLFVFLHIGIIFTLHVGLFPYVCITMWLALLPSHFWENIYANTNKIKIYFDKDCGFCKKMAYLLKDFLLLNNTQISPQSVNYEIENLMEKENSWILRENDQTYFRFEGITHLLKGSIFWRPLGKFLSLPFNMKIGTFCYNYVASNRKKFSFFTKKIDLNFSKVSLKNSALVETFGLMVIMSIVNWNLGEIKKLHYNRAPYIMGFVRYFHLYQNWGMFSPYPKKTNSWFIFEGELVNGQKHDYFSNSDIYSFDQPVNIQKFIKSKEWRKLFLNIEDNKITREIFARYLCRYVNQAKGVLPDDKLRTLKMYTLSKNMAPENEEKVFNKDMIWNHFCFDKDWKSYQEENGDKLKDEEK